jgi:glucokinase
MGGTKILGCALNSEEGIVYRIKRPTEVGENPALYIKHLTEVIMQTAEGVNIEKNNVKAVCLGVPGSVNPYSGRIGLAPNLGLKNFFIKEKLEKRIPFPVLIENDVNLGALGIKRFGVGKEAKNLIAVFVGTGIGGGLIIDDKIYRGSSFAAGEIGHMIIEEGGPLCGCGNKGCFEAVASRTAIAKNIVNDLKNDKKSFLKKISKSGEKIKSKSLAEAIKRNDKIVVKHISNASHTIGLVLANVANLLNFDMVVLGGGLIEALDYYMIPAIRNSFKKYALKDIAKGVKILPSKLGDDAAIFGGIPLAEEFLGVKV